MDKVKELYVTLGMLGVALIGPFILAMLYQLVGSGSGTERTLTAGGFIVIVFMQIFIMTIVGTIAAFISAAIFGLSFGNLGTALLRFAAIFALVQTVGMLLGCFSIIPAVILIFCFVSYLFSMEFSEVKWFVVVLIIINALVNFGFRAAMGI